MRHFAFAMLTAAPLLASAAVPGTVLAAPVQVTRFATPDTVTRLGAARRRWFR
jgi:ethanolamine utilization microcompartment shell protein EutL